jgi:hypothetical protein
MDKILRQELEHSSIDYVWDIFTEFLEFFALALFMISNIGSI